MRTKYTDEPKSWCQGITIIFIDCVHAANLLIDKPFLDSQITQAPPQNFLEFHCSDPK